MKHPSTTRIEHQDLGASGLAMQARPAEFHSLEGKSRGSINAVRIEVVRYQDATLFDRMHRRAQLNDVQFLAAERLYGLFCGAGLNPCTVSQIDIVREIDDAHDDDVIMSDGADEDTLLDHYRSVMRSRSPGHAALLEALMLGQHPGVRFLASLQAALSDLAKDWGMA